MDGFGAGGRVRFAVPLDSPSDGITALYCGTISTMAMHRAGDRSFSAKIAAWAAMALLVGVGGCTAAVESSPRPLPSPAASPEPSPSGESPTPAASAHPTAPVSTGAWFAGYVDVTAWPPYPFEQDGGATVLAFIVAGGAACTPSWGSAYSLDAAGETLDLDARIATAQGSGHDVVVSFGGAASTDLGDACESPEDLAGAYAEVIDRYSLSTIDLDIEGAALAKPEGIERRAQAVRALQETRDLSVWLTLPVLPDGLTADGLSAVRTFLEAEVDIAGVNAMTMDFGISGTVIDHNKSALQALQGQISVLYADAGMPISDADAWATVGATPMIGQNDVQAEVLSLDNARELNAFAHDHGIGRMSMWSVNRDRTCGTDIDPSYASSTCSGVEQAESEFATILSEGFAGAPTTGAPTTGAPTAGAPTARGVSPEGSTEGTSKPSHAQSSGEWSERAAYVAGDHVMWNGKSYRAKWWTQGEAPDKQVANEWDTPWEETPSK